MAINCNACKNPCNCVVSDDGAIILDGSYNFLDNPSRRNSVVSGNGTLANPYTVSFIDSEFYRPVVGEAVTPVQSITDSDLNFVDLASGTVIYSSPTPASLSLRDDEALVFGLFLVVGITVTFTGSTTGVRKIAILEISAEGNVNRVIGSSSCSADTEDLTLNASGFTMGRLVGDLVNIVQFNRFSIAVQQSSGGALNISSASLWIASVG